MKLKFLPVIFLGTLTTTAAAQTPPDAPAPPAPAQAVTLRLNLQAGQTYTMRMTSAQKMSQTIQGKRMDMNTNTRMSMSMKVKSVDADGVMSVEMSYLSMAVNTAGTFGANKMATSFDSERPQQKPSPENNIMSALIGQSLQMKMAPTGQVKEIHGLDAIWQRIIERTPTPKGTDRRLFVQRLQSMRETFGEQNISNLSNSLAYFPVSPVRVGDSWHNSSTMKSSFPISVKTKYTLQDIKSGIARLGIASTLQMASGAEMAKSMAMPGFRFSLSGTQTGTMEVSTLTGSTLKGDVVIRFAGRMTVPDPAHKGKTVSWPLYVKGTSVIETIPDNPNIIRVDG